MTVSHLFCTWVCIELIAAHLYRSIIIQTKIGLLFTCGNKSIDRTLKEIEMKRNYRIWTKRCESNLLLNFYFLALHSCRSYKISNLHIVQLWLADFFFFFWRLWTACDSINRIASTVHTFHEFCIVLLCDQFHGTVTSITFDVQFLCL